MIDERARHQLYLSLERELGAAEADTMMDLLPPVGWADIATKRDLDALEDRMNRRFDHMEEKFATKEDVAGAVRELTRLMVTLMVGMMLTLTAIMVTAIALVR